MPTCAICLDDLSQPCAEFDPANDNFPGGPSDPAPDIGMRVQSPANDNHTLVVAELSEFTLPRLYGLAFRTRAIHRGGRRQLSGFVVGSIYDAQCQGVKIAAADGNELDLDDDKVDELYGEPSATWWGIWLASPPKFPRRQIISKHVLFRVQCLDIAIRLHCPHWSFRKRRRGS